MIAILLSSLLMIFGFVYTFSDHPTAKKLRSLCFQSLSPHDIPKTNQFPSSKQPSNDVINTRNTTLSKSEQMKGVFATFDKNKDGFITKQELEESLKNIGICAGEGDVSDMLQKLDSNGDGVIDLDEFCKIFDRDQDQDQTVLLSSGMSRDGDAELREAFDVFDENGDGVITVDELGLVLSSMGFVEGKMMESCKEMIRRVDVDGDGKVNFDEFKTMMRSGFGNGRVIPFS